MVITGMDICLSLAEDIVGNLRVYQLLGLHHSSTLALASTSPKVYKGDQ
jgi:hypothetical protein